MFIEIALWVCAGWVLYVYVGYPACAFLVALILNRDVRRADIEPRVAVIISAFNEEREIERTVLNKLSQDYPADRLEVIVVSDGSTDRTDGTVQNLMSRGEGRLRLLRQEPRQGKTQALNMALRQTSAEVVVFADANSIYAPTTVRSLVRSFSDPSVGYATGRMVYTNPGRTAVGEGSGSYMSYENFLRSLETRLGSVVGVDGGVDAIRRKLYVPMRPDQLPDFVLPLAVIEQGKRVVYDPDAVVYEPALSDTAEEFRMRVRVSLRALWALYDMRHLLNPLRYPLFAWQLVSHKVLRYLAFLPLAGLLVFNALAFVQYGSFVELLVLQAAAYALAAVGYVFRRSGAGVSKLLAPYYFVILNLACVVAFWKFLSGQKMIVWNPRKGT